MSNNRSRQIKALSFLVVEDNAFTSIVVCETLKSLGAAVIETASTGREALDVIVTSETSPDVLLVDLRMPEMGGVELIKRLAEQRYEGHVVLTSGIWSKVLNRCGDDFPYINSLKSMTGHCIAATGSIESVACVLQLKEGFIHPSLNSEDLHPDINSTISPEKVPQKAIYPRNLDIIVKANFGFGDVNSCVVFRKWND